MKLYMSVDMEGITGLVDSTFVRSDQQNYTKGREMMTDEANYVIQAAIEEGVDDIVVNDSHSQMNNLLIDRLHPEAKLISGRVKPYSMVQGLDSSFAGAIFTGYHARGAKPGVMSHTMTFAVHNMAINDIEIGEIGFNAFVAGYYGVPVLMVAGDDAAAAEAEELIPGVTTAIVKEQISRSCALCLTPQKSGEILRRQTKVALANRGKVKPLVPPDQPLLRIHFANYGQAEYAHMLPGTELEGSSSVVRYHAKDILEAYRAMLVMITLALNTTYC